MQSEGEDRRKWVPIFVCVYYYRTGVRRRKYKLGPTKQIPPGKRELKKSVVQNFKLPPTVQVFSQKLPRFFFAGLVPRDIPRDVLTDQA